jgi:GNAT superfamily N-acetyltransferase
MTIRRAGSADLEAVRDIFREYQAAVDAPVCFAGFEKELAALPDGYFSILLAGDTALPAACVALRESAPGVAEMKRLYVRPQGRGQGLGRRLVEAAIDEARAADYATLRLDTLPVMAEAIALYRSMNFRPIERYNATPDPETLFFEMTL